MRKITGKSYAAPDIRLFGIRIERGFTASQPYPGGGAEPFDQISAGNDDFSY